MTEICLKLENLTYLNCIRKLHQTFLRESWAPWQPLLPWGCVDSGWAAWVFGTGGLNLAFIPPFRFSEQFLAYPRLLLSDFSWPSMDWVAEQPHNLSALAGRRCLDHACCVEGTESPPRASSVCTVILCWLSLLHCGKEAEDLLSPFTVRQVGPRLPFRGLLFWECTLS